MAEIIWYVGVVVAAHAVAVGLLWRHADGIDKRLSPRVEELATKVAYLEGGIERDRKLSSLTGDGRRRSEP